MGFVFIAGAACAALSGGSAPLFLKQTIELPGVQGRIDHVAHDHEANRLFVAALGNNSVEVVDLAAGKGVASLKSFSEPQGVVYVEESHRLYVASGGDGTVRVLDGKTFSEVADIKVGDDADNLRYDATARKIYVGYGSGALGVIDPATNTLAYSIALRGHPESFQLEQTGTRIFVNVPGAHEVAVVDREARKQIGKWKLGLVAANFPLALDESHHRAFVASRMPARILIFDTTSGREIAKLDLHGDCDDLFFDSSRGLIYASCGEGFIDVFKQATADDYALVAAIKTTPGARTALLADGKVFLAVPQQHGRTAHVDVYEMGSP